MTKIIIIMATILVISIIGISFITYFENENNGLFKWVNKIPEVFWDRARLAFTSGFLMSFCVLSVCIGVKIYERNKGSQKTEDLETYIIENSIPLYLQNRIEDSCADFYNYFEIKISEDGTYATLIPKN